MGKEVVPVKAVRVEKTYIGRVAFPEAIPEGLIDYFQFPADLVQQAAALGLQEHTLRFLMGALRGRWAVTAPLDLPDLALKTGLSYPEMDQIVRELVAKEYARISDRLDLYRLWICVLHLKGVRFVTAEQ